MPADDLLQKTIERFWDTVPPVWGWVRGNLRAQATRDFQLSLLQFHILRHIRRGASSVAELADWQQVSRPAVSIAVEGLAARGLVSRETDPRDRRFTRLALTRAGGELLEQLFSRNRAWMAAGMADLSRAELEALLRAMDILSATFLSPR